MALRHTLATLLILGPLLQAPAGAQHVVDCREWHECRQLALAAYASGDYERFHDLAWRTVQTGPARNADLMYLLARAQSLSGRPHDALVMLTRLAEMGVTTDAMVNDEFRVVRTLPGWPAAEALILGAAQPPPAAGRDVTSSPAAAPGPAAYEARASVRPLLTPVDALRVPSATLNPTGLSYDRVSGRFVVADRHARALSIIDERSRHLVDLVSAESAGFYDITALEIDVRRGDLWVVSAVAPESNGKLTTVLHMLQLVSGRPLIALPLPEPFGPARFDDVAVSDRGTVFMLDGLGGRVFRLGTDKRSFVVAGALRVDHLTSFAPADDRIAYVAYAGGIARLDLSTGAALPLPGPKDAELSGFERIRWDRDSLVGIQRLPDGTRRVVRVRLARTGRRALAVDVVAPDVSMTDPMAATLVDHVFYFVTRESHGGDQEPEIVVHRVPLP
ncbi:MAG TPA: hypothetical protein VGX46_15075 [Vicinamibacterales bacterium]|nr:hypothetical protein [Vicinamibacterales bacterium]